MVKLAVDLGGADVPQEELALGALQALKKREDLFLYLCGDARQLAFEHIWPRRYSVFDAPEVITNEEEPAAAVQTKNDSSLIRTMLLCREDPKIDGLVTCGATGAVMAGAITLLKRAGGPSPMLLCQLRRVDGSPFCLVDCGASVDCRPEKLVDFARAGRAYMRALGVEKPKIALLSNGREAKKGNRLTVAAHTLLRESGLYFLGNIEAGDILTGPAHVVVCEGFAGNILLKSMEGTAKAVLGQCRSSDAGLYAQYDYTHRGGAVLLGASVLIVKGHGAADRDTMSSVVEQAYRLAKNRLSEKIMTEFSNVEGGCNGAV